MERLELSAAVGPLYGSLGVKGVMDKTIKPDLISIASNNEEGPRCIHSKFIFQHTIV